MKKLSRFYIINELRNLLFNWYIPGFGILFSLLMSQIIIRAVIGDVPAVAHQEISTSIALSFLQLVPLAVVFWGHSSLYSQEIQKRIPLRMQLFGFSQGTQMLGRMIFLMIFLPLESSLTSVYFP